MLPHGFELSRARQPFSSKKSPAINEETRERFLI
jgi:hypothetical protein